jgi:hypothetical protein
MGIHDRAAGIRLVLTVARTTRRILVAVRRLGASLPSAVLSLILVACAPTVSPTPGVTPVESGAAPESGSPSPPAIVIECHADAAPQPALGGDPCPGAITAVELAVAPVRLPIERIVIQPGPFYCDVIWPGVRSAPVCFGTLVIPGQYMHAWVSFERSDKVAAVMLGRDLPADLNVPATVPLPWNATLVAAEVPPTGWEMP